MTDQAIHYTKLEQNHMSVQVPWLDYAKAKLQILYETAGTQDLDTRASALETAIELAQNGFETRVRTVGGDAVEGNSPDQKLKRDQEKERFRNKVVVLRQQIEAPLKVGSAYGLQQLLIFLHDTLKTEPTVADVQKVLCLATTAPPALIADDDPLAEKLDPNWDWVKKVTGTLIDWSNRLDSFPPKKSWQGEGWNHAWASAAALTELDRWLSRANYNYSGLAGEQDLWERVIAAMLRPERPISTKYSTRSNGTYTCLPTDKSKPYLVARLQVSPWLALTLDPKKKKWQVTSFDTNNQQALWSRRFRVCGLGDMSKTESFRSNGLLVGHLYASIFIQALDQRLNTASILPMSTLNAEPQDKLPIEVQNASDPGDWKAASMTIAFSNERALATHNARATGQSIKMGKRTNGWKTRLAPPSNSFILPKLRPLPAELLEWRPPPDSESESLGTIRLSPVALNASLPPQYTDCTVLVKLKNYWHVVYPELWDFDDEENEEEGERVALNSYAALPPALQEAGGWPRLAMAMSQACWVGHFRGLGMLLIAALDLDRES